METRGPVSVSVWGDNPTCLQMAKVLEKVAQEWIWGPDVYFIPEDPFDIVYNLTIGDLCEVEAMMELEDIFEQKFSDDFMISLYKANMSEAVDLFLSETKANSKDLEKYLKSNSPSKNPSEILTAWGLLIIAVVVALLLFLFL